MTEAEWVKQLASSIQKAPWVNDEGVSVRTGLKLAYGSEILSYGSNPDLQSIDFETDLALIEVAAGGRWTPRIVVEAKLGSMTTHDAITYSQKAESHRAVHPYLRYGMMLGNRQDHPLPGRLYRHGAQFDFMISFRGLSRTRMRRQYF